MSKISSPQVDKWRNKSPPLRADMIFLNLLHCNVMTKTIWLASLSVLTCCFEISLSVLFLLLWERSPHLLSLPMCKCHFIWNLIVPSSSLLHQRWRRLPWDLRCFSRTALLPANFMISGSDWFRVLVFEFLRSEDFGFTACPRCVQISSLGYVISLLGIFWELINNSDREQKII